MTLCVDWQYGLNLAVCLALVAWCVHRLTIGGGEGDSRWSIGATGVVGLVAALVNLVRLFERLRVVEGCLIHDVFGRELRRVALGEVAECRLEQKKAWWDPVYPNRVHHFPVVELRDGTTHSFEQFWRRDPQLAGGRHPAMMRFLSALDVGRMDNPVS